MAVATPTNPYLAGASIALNALSGSSLKQSGAAAGTSSGFGTFGAENDISRKKRIIDFSNPVHVAIASIGAVLIVAVYKKFKR